MLLTVGQRIHPYPRIDTFSPVFGFVRYVISPPVISDSDEFPDADFFAESHPASASDDTAAPAPNRFKKVLLSMFLLSVIVIWIKLHDDVHAPLHILH